MGEHLYFQIIDYIPLLNPTNASVISSLVLDKNTQQIMLYLVRLSMTQQIKDTIDKGNFAV